MPAIYMGKNSIAGIPSRGKVNTDKEVLLNIHATAYDSINKFMLDQNSRKLERTDPRLIHGRFSILKTLCRKYTPNKLPLVNRMENLALAHSNGRLSDMQYLQMIRSESMRHGVNSGFLNMIESKINSAEARARMSKQKPVFLPFQGIIKEKSGPGRLPLPGMPFFAFRKQNKAPRRSLLDFKGKKQMPLINAPMGMERPLLSRVKHNRNMPLINAPIRMEQPFFSKPVHKKRVPLFRGFKPMEKPSPKQRPPSPLSGWFKKARSNKARLF